LTIVLVVCACVVGVAEDTPAVEPTEQMLHRARVALKGADKDIAGAREILLDIAQNRADDLNPTGRCYVYVYLGYIEDREGNREAAVSWFEKAAVLEGPDIKWIRQLAEIGLTKPVTWIRHLDQGATPEKESNWEENIIERIGEGYVTRDKPPDSLVRKMALTKDEQLENFDILWEAVDRTFSFFNHKGIDWQEVKTRYRPQVEAVETTEAFYALLGQCIRELKDAHSWLCNHRPNQSLPWFGPAITTALIEGKAVVTDVVEDSEAYKSGLRPGWVIEAVDGLMIAETVEQLRPLLRVHSSERAFLQEAYRRLLCGDDGATVSLEALPPDGGAPMSLELKRGTPKQRSPVEPAFPLEKSAHIWWGVHPSGCGYIRVLSFDGRMEIADEFDQALESLRNAPALVLDIRDNPGGFGDAQPRIVGRFIAERVKVGVSYVKNGPEHDDFRMREQYFAPAGRWQYTKPLALLMNTGTGSAADLFACYMSSTGRPITVGTTTHGNLTGVGAYVVLPCDLVVRVSNGYVCDARGNIIEGNGTAPQVHAARTIRDVIEGTDSVLDRAVQALEEIGHRTS